MNAALSGVAEHSLVAEVVALARWVNPAVLRSLDAIHLVSALLLDADVVLTYDQHLAEARHEGDLTVTAPGSVSVPPTAMFQANPEVNQAGTGRPVE